MIYKYWLIPLLTVIILALGATPVFAGGYNPDSEVTSTPPHSGYATTSNKCKSCHAVHLAAGQYRMLRPAGVNAATACEYCHGQSGIVVTKMVWLDNNGHGVSTEQAGDIVVPDDTTYTVFRNDLWGCVACHSPHGSDVVVLSNEPSITTSMILRKFPNPNKPSGNAYYSGTSTTGTLTITAWCSNCHEANFGSHTEGKSTPVGIRYGHDSSTTGYQMADSTWAVVDSDDATNTGPTCRQCHTSDNASDTITKKFPHAGGGSWKMLKASSPTGTPGPIEEDKLDKLCASPPCHDATDLP